MEFQNCLSKTISNLLQNWKRVTIWSLKQKDFEAENIHNLAWIFWALNGFLCLRAACMQDCLFVFLFTQYAAQTRFQFFLQPNDQFCNFVSRIPSTNGRKENGEQCQSYFAFIYSMLQLRILSRSLLQESRTCKGHHVFWELITCCWKLLAKSSFYISQHS